MSISFRRLQVEQTLAVAALAAAIELHDSASPGHNARVSDLAVTIGVELEVDEETLTVLENAGLLHDLGKLGIADSILRKPGPLTAEEWVVMKRHPNLGLEVLEKIGGMEGVKEVVWSHHERLDGSGYPRGLKADAISIAVRIIAVADTYDCMTSERPYHMAVGTEKALKKIHAERKDTLDPKCVEALEKVLAGNSKLYLPSLAEMPFFVGERRVGVFNRRWQGETERRTRLGLPEIETL